MASSRSRLHWASSGFITYVDDLHGAARFALAIAFDCVRYVQRQVGVRVCARIYGVYVCVWLEEIGLGGGVVGWGERRRKWVSFADFVACVCCGKRCQD